MEMIYSGASSHAKIDEYSVSDKNKSPKTKKRIIENVQETSAKAVVLNNRDVIIKPEHVNIVRKYYNEEIVESSNLSTIMKKY
ncbi:hypothetical protein GLOIN_2v1777257 [Rhizophagus irregularis DAOM 181602=DAOM 197198]|uniref:Uncharacterized protein n=1 Tax=Rhizophagus irregularis (strain DAOM 181602 / DAOM 197198 / MUCL 43194) TaxID=747089 RepID=A0A2P4PVA0_RHIID|nr:hypothetical protein GLOIN_2v1777257 [Rhizophagus irregularis DAOM 181602=DAOM 197198]POG69301.1 hypothetical protein GLOIN_2v1777257 [Rhizophagus irregularis DAOM 181602=DAOM 197198]|eukprot:XP_025176167.1 hypothetical protein GLOIN_2v1777257 [Rhizophagus irregularis DAOM 181602=DAOM 197198]